MSLTISDYQGLVTNDRHHEKIFNSRGGLADQTSTDSEAMGTAAFTKGNNGPFCS